MAGLIKGEILLTVHIVLGLILGEVIMRLHLPEKLLSRIAHVPLMILDDLGAERDTAFAREQLCSAIDLRADSALPLICTTNFKLEEMRDTADPVLQRVFDRLNTCVPVPVIGESRRTKIRTEKLKIARELLELE